MDPVILKTVEISLQGHSQHVFCMKHCKDNVEKHISGLISPTS